MILTLPFPSGEIPELFSEEEIEGIVTSVRAEVRRLGLLDSRENCWKFFTGQVQLQLKVRCFKIFLPSFTSAFSLIIFEE